MEITPIDILIIGSGPAGMSTALHLVQQDASWSGRMIVLDKAVHPREKLCGGGITFLGQNILARLGLEMEPAHFPVREVRLVYQNVHYSFLGNPVLWIVHRAEFDHWLVRKGEERGVQIRQGEGVLEVIPHENYVEVVTDKQIYHAQTVVAADGSRSKVRAKLKLNEESQVARLIEVLTPETTQSSWEFRDGVAVFDFSHMTAGLQGYYWDFPSIVDGKTQMNRGVFDSRARPERPKVNLPDLLSQELEARQRHLEDYELKGHPIRWFSSKGQLARPRVLLAGDSAGADPLFGEGIAIALAYGEAAAQELISAFEQHNFSFAGYKKRVLDHPILWQLPWRVWLAEIAYMMKYPRLVRFCWHIARLVIKLTSWRSKEYSPALQIQLVNEKR